jgi:hypothetical protein
MASFRLDTRPLRVVRPASLTTASVPATTLTVVSATRVAMRRARAPRFSRISLGIASCSTPVHYPVSGAGNGGHGQPRY